MIEDFRRGRRHPCRHRRQDLQGGHRRGDLRHAPQGQDGQLRHHLRHLGLRTGRAHERRPPGSQGADRRLLRHLPAREGLHGHVASRWPANRATWKPSSTASASCPTSTRATAVVRGYAERNAINAPIQGSAADIIKGGHGTASTSASKVTI